MGNQYLLYEISMNFDKSYCFLISSKWVLFNKDEAYFLNQPFREERNEVPLFYEAIKVSLPCWDAFYSPLQFFAEVTVFGGYFVPNTASPADCIGNPQNLKICPITVGQKLLFWWRTRFDWSFI